MPPGPRRPRRRRPGAARGATPPAKGPSPSPPPETPRAAAGAVPAEPPQQQRQPGAMQTWPAFPCAAWRRHGRPPRPPRAAAAATAVCARGASSTATDGRRAGGSRAGCDALAALTASWMSRSSLDKIATATRVAAACSVRHSRRARLCSAPRSCVDCLALSLFRCTTAGAAAGGAAAGAAAGAAGGGSASGGSVDCSDDDSAAIARTSSCGAALAAATSSWTHSEGSKDQSTRGCSGQGTSAGPVNPGPVC